ncbi:MAG: LON peptidase substrate-binding domain-containing protein [Myxococcota bacterium]|nr:LON peptidase substrate-binding domain-containing protein [Myxococcota bacterium]
MKPEDLIPGSVIEALPIFPLPNVVLFPRTVLPLHVFEPRYLDMVSDIMDSDRLMGIVQLASGWEADYYGTPPLCPVLGVGELLRQRAADDGRINISVKGLRRASVLGEIAGDTPYRRVSVEILEEVPGVTPGQLATVRQIFASILAGIEGAKLEDAAVLFDAELDPGLLIDAIATAAPLSPQSKQILLEEHVQPDRADQLAEFLIELATDMTEWSEAGPG